VTACGVVAVQWPMLFYGQFDPSAPTTCAACAALVLIGRGEGALSPRVSTSNPNAHQTTQQ